MLYPTVLSVWHDSKGLSTLATLLPFSATNCFQKRQQIVADLLPFSATICCQCGQALTSYWLGTCPYSMCFKPLILSVRLSNLCISVKVKVKRYSPS